MAKKKKYYVVWEGLNPGIYDSWEACKVEIKGYPNAKYKSYKSKEEALLALELGYDQSNKKRSHLAKNQPLNDQIKLPSISVDGACSGNPGVTEYQGVITDTQEQLFYGGPFQGGSNNLGEFLALVHAISLMKKQGKENMPIYTDSKTAMAWLRNRKVKTTINRNKINETIFILVDRAEKWIQNNSWKNPILKWETKLWGEIPADFGRK
jgi:ribonuclease HI